MSECDSPVLTGVVGGSKDSDTHRKRKASPTFSVAKKTLYTRVGRGGAKQDRSPSTPSSPSSSSSSFVEMMLGAFADPSFHRGFQPVVQGLMVPVVQAAIDKAVKATAERLRTDVLDGVSESVRSMGETIAGQQKVIEVQRAEMDVISGELDRSKTRVDELERQLKALTVEVDEVRRRGNDLEQYGRRNSVRISGYEAKGQASESELKTEMVAFLNARVLKGQGQLSVSDVERCHPVGRPGGGARSQILVKFSGFSAKHQVYAAKSSLKGARERIFISEDLTRANYQLVKALVPLKRTGKIVAFWTSNGMVLAKKADSSRPVRLSSMNDIDRLVA